MLPGVDTTNVFSRAAGQIRRSLPGQGRWTGSWHERIAGPNHWHGRGPQYKQGHGSGRDVVNRSRWWPSEEKKGDSFDQASQQIRDALLPAQTWRQNPISTNSSASPQASAGRRGPPQLCRICSHKQLPPQTPKAVIHHHFSSKELRRTAGIVNSGEVYLCPTCEENGTPGKKHEANTEDRIKVALSSSTLHEFWMDGQYSGDSIHIDWVTSPGATIQSLRTMWRHDYGDERKPQDIVVIAGLNNIKNEDADKIMKRIKDFTNEVMEQSVKLHHPNPSTISFATLIYPPQFCWFPADGPEPYDGYVNKLAMMRALNDRIIAHNDRVFVQQKILYKKLTEGEIYTRSRAPRFHTYGLRKTTVTWTNGRRVGTTGHRWEHWRTSEPRERALHLGDVVRRRMGNAIVNFFKYQYYAAK